MILDQYMNYGERLLTIRRAPEPNDIIWYNLGIDSQIIVLR